MLTSRLHNFAFYDPLTGLANRLRFLQTLNETILSKEKLHSALSLIDIDHFAETNDALGHHFGDLLLCAVALRLSKYFGDGFQLARVGSDTFALLGPESMVRPESIIALFTSPFKVDNQDVQLSATIGLIKLCDYEGDGSEALKDSNIALKRAKTHQRAGYTYFTRNMGVEIRERVRMMHALREAFESQHFIFSLSASVKYAQWQSGRSRSIVALENRRWPLHSTRPVHSDCRIFWFNCGDW